MISKDISDDLNSKAKLRCLVTHKAAIEVYPGKFEFITYPKGLILPRKRIQLDRKKWEVAKIFE